MPPKGRLVVQIAKIKPVELGNQIVFKWTTGWSEIIAQANEVNAEVLEKFLDYVYTGEVEVKYT